ncbi:hypothetical protein Pmani_026602 [Petrolisthes manimaculis]|uniref:Uncharacterized protein n=1 Tax=Petrolisthes manimaculis TaxID=1843537 RepID=A0AAE1P5Q0_9EUCA|nr:hypothetical protein Pmani_026602 [Petrolisthes manimaculis]
MEGCREGKGGREGERYGVARGRMEGWEGVVRGRREEGREGVGELRLNMGSLWEGTRGPTMMDETPCKMDDG